MRVDLLTVGPAHDQAAIHFHARLTVVGGLDRPARAAFAQLMLHALRGDDEELWGARWVDSTGEVLVGERDTVGWRWSDTRGEPAAAPCDVLGLDTGALRRLMVVTRSDLVRPGTLPEGVNPELDEARAALATADDELNAALAVGAHLDALRAEVAGIDEQVAAVEADESRRRYAAVASELRRARAEALAQQRGVIEADHRYMAAADEVRGRAEDWRQMLAAVRVERSRWGDRERLDARTLVEALDSPQQVPPELESLSSRYEAAEAARAGVAARLHTVTTGALGEVSHPAVARLAQAPQDELWAAAHRALDAAKHLEHQSLALGGLQAEGVSPAAAALLESAHDAVDLQVREVERRRVLGLAGALGGLLFTLVAMISFPPLMAVGVLGVIGLATWAMVLPQRELGRRQQEEADALQQAGVASYITFQVRRLEVNIDPRATEPLELAALEYRRALAAWRKFAGDLAPADALQVEAETRAHAESLGRRRGAADEIARLRYELDHVAGPAVADARAKLLAACRPFGVEDPDLAIALVRHQAELGGVARRQAALEHAEREERAKKADLGAALGALGFMTDGSSDGELERCLRAFEEAREQALAREVVRRRARPLPTVEADVARLEAQVAAEWRPEWDDEVTGLVLDVDVEALRARRAQAVAEYEAAYRSLPDIPRLADRRQALERRVEVLTNGAFDEAMLDIAEVQQVLLGRLASARRVGPSGESVSVVFDEPFERVHGDRKWALLDSLEKLSASVQLVYLTDDVDVLLWARGRTSRGAVSLLEPTRDAA